jgi:hypothetical protein
MSCRGRRRGPLFRALVAAAAFRGACPRGPWGDRKALSGLAAHPHLASVSVTAWPVAWSSR